VTARVARSRRWAGGLPALIVLLLLLIAGSGVGRRAEGAAFIGAETALGAAPAVTQPAAVPRADVRLLVKRSGNWAPGQVLAARSVPVLRVHPPTGWSAVTGPATAANRAGRGEVYQGRAPPVRVVIPASRP
jgi:hypothetical protein